MSKNEKWTGFPYKISSPNSQANWNLVLEDTVSIEDTPDIYVSRRHILAINASAVKALIKQSGGNINTLRSIHEKIRSTVSLDLPRLEKKFEVVLEKSIVLGSVSCDQLRNITLDFGYPPFTKYSPSFFFREFQDNPDSLAGLSRTIQTAIDGFEAEPRSLRVTGILPYSPIRQNLNDGIEKINEMAKFVQYLVAPTFCLSSTTNAIKAASSLHSETNNRQPGDMTFAMTRESPRF